MWWSVGTTAAYCGTGCQVGFGSCTGSESTPIDPNLCGPLNGNNKCLSGLCCSSHGYCGNTTDYCTTGCQPQYGDCTATTGGDGDGTCGPAFGNAVCPAGQCCSPAGYCGTTEDYCADPDCQLDFGTCDSDHTPAGASTLNDPRPLLGSISYDDDVYDCVQNNVVALTFDDGPYLYTNELLDVLKSYGFKATFFMTGNNLGKGPIDTTAPYPTVIKRMISEGHQVASHTWSHYSLSNITSAQRKQQMVKNERAIANIIGKYPTYMRPPYSQCDVASGCQADMKALGYHRIYFDLDTQDYLNPLPSQIQTSKNVVKAALAIKGATDYLSIQHDLVEQSVTNLTSYYCGLIQAKGWKGVSAGTCLQDPQTNWYRTPVGSGTTSTVKVSSTSTSKKLSTSSHSATIPTPKPAAPTPTTCAVKAGSFCGTIFPFSDRAGCQKSAASCFVQSSSCSQQAGKQNAASCTKYMQSCQNLNTYCLGCRTTCSSTGFKG